MQRRLSRKAAWKLWATEGIGAVNDLYGRGPAPPPDSEVGVSTAQSECLEQFIAAYRKMGVPPEDCNDAAGAFEELCGSRPGYLADVASAGAPLP